MKDNLFRDSSVDGDVTVKSSPLSRRFYVRGTVRVARDLLGKHLVRFWQSKRMECRIVEVEAYGGNDDPASHAFRGPTVRNAPMFGEPGHAYIYFTYGNHYCLNVTTQRSGVPGAVLIRAVQPLAGLKLMRRLRPRVSDQQLTNGPGKLTKALAIDKSLNEVDMTRRGPLFIIDSMWEPIKISRSPRVGIKYGGDRLWRFYVADNPFVSKS